MQIEGVMGIRDLHVWKLAGDTVVATLHVQVRSAVNEQKIIRDVQGLFRNVVRQLCFPHPVLRSKDNHLTLLYREGGQPDCPSGERQVLRVANEACPPALDPSIQPVHSSFGSSHHQHFSLPLDGVFCLFER